MSAYNAEDLGSIPGSRRFPGEGNGIPFCILVWKIPWIEEPSRLPYIGSQRVGHDFATEHACKVNEWTTVHFQTALVICE